MSLIKTLHIQTPIKQNNKNKKLNKLNINIVVSEWINIDLFIAEW